MDSHNRILSPDVPVQRFMLVLSYNGAPYHGWQIQPGDHTVQEHIETALRTALRIPVLHIVGAGRTDTGVNARHMTAHVDIPADIAANLSTQRLIHTLNAILKTAITIHHIVPVAPDAHARFDATARTYRYFIHTSPDPFRATSSRYITTHPDIEVMNEAANLLIGTHDFTSFSKLHTDTKTNICTITAAQWYAYGPTHYFFEITADRFLRNMVRAIVGTLLNIGEGKNPPTHITHVLKAADRRAAGISVPGNALYLWNITYPYPLPQSPLPQTL